MKSAEGILKEFPERLLERFQGVIPKIENP